MYKIANKYMALDIYKKLNDETFFRFEEENGIKFVKVARKNVIKNKESFPFDYDTLNFDDFFGREFNAMFAKICPCLVWQEKFGWIGLWVQVQNTKTQEEREFLIVRRNVGQLLGSLAMMSAGDPIKDRNDVSYIFAKPVIMDDLHDKFMEFVMSGDEDDYLEFIKEKAAALRKYCMYKTRGIGSIMRASDRLTDVVLSEKIKAGIDL